MRTPETLIATFILIMAIGVIAVAESNIAIEDSVSAASGDTLKSSLTILPAVFYTPETKLGFGVYPSYIFRFSPNCRPSSLAFLAYYTVRKQVSLSFDPNLYFRDNQYILSGTIFYEKWPNDFFGFGTGVSKDDAEDYTTRNTGFDIGIKRRIAGDLYAGPLFGYAYSKFLEIEEGGVLATGGITGAGDGANSGAGIAVSWEGQDNTFYPGSGEYLELEYAFFGRTIGGDYTYRNLTVDMRKYFSISGSDVLALQLYGDFIYGDAPFRSYSQVGQVVRGYLPTLYTEKKLVAAQAEYRFVPLWRRFGATLFAGAGTVARTLSGFENSRLKFAAGIGFRFILVESEKVNIRVDYGIGQDSAELYLAAGEAF